MPARLTRPILLGAYQLSLLVGIIFLPVALLLGRLGVTIPVHRLVQRLSGAYDRTIEATR